MESFNTPTLQYSMPLLRGKISKDYGKSESKQRAEKTPESNKEESS